MICKGCCLRDSDEHELLLPHGSEALALGMSEAVCGAAV